MIRIKYLLIIIGLLLFSNSVFAGGEKGIFANGNLQTKTTTLSASASTATITGYPITFFGPANLGGDLTIVIKSTLNSGAYPTVTVYVRKYYDSDLGYSDWFSVGTFNSDGTHDFNIASSSFWFYCNGYQVKVEAASGTYNISLIGKAFVR